MGVFHPIMFQMMISIHNPFFGGFNRPPNMNKFEKLPYKMISGNLNIKVKLSQMPKFKLSLNIWKTCRVSYRYTKLGCASK